MKPSHAILLAALTAFAAPSARAAGETMPFAAFQAVCLTPNAALDAVKAAAAAWRDTEVTGAAPFPGVTVTETISKAFKAGGEPLTLYAYTGVNKGGVHFSECQMRVTKAEFYVLNADAASFAGFAAQDSTPKRATYRYTLASGHAAAVDSAGFDAAAAAEGLDILTVTGDSHGAMIGLLKIKK